MALYLLAPWLPPRTPSLSTNPLRRDCVHPVDDEEIAVTMPEILTRLAAAAQSQDDQRSGE
jgi:hypothetical protein